MKKQSIKIEITKNNYEKIEEVLRIKQLRRTNYRVDLGDILLTKMEAKKTIRMLGRRLADYEGATVIYNPTHTDYKAKYSSKGVAFELRIIKGKFYLVDIDTRYRFYCSKSIEIVLPNRGIGKDIFTNKYAACKIEGYGDVISFKLRNCDCIFDYQIKDVDSFKKVLDKITDYFPKKTSNDMNAEIDKYLRNNIKLSRKLKLIQFFGNKAS